LSEPPPQGYENVTDILPPYNAFSAQGVPEVRKKSHVGVLLAEVIFCETLG